MDKNNILIIKNSLANDNDYWEVMNDNNIIDFIRREPDSLVIYTLEEYSRLCKDTILLQTQIMIQCMILIVIQIKKS